MSTSVRIVGEQLYLWQPSWWALTVRGVAALVFGVLAVLWPELSLLVLVLLFGAFTFVDGMCALILALQRRHATARWWAPALQGLAGVLIGVLTFLWPGLTGLALLYLIAAWALITGVLEIVVAVWLRKVITGEWLLGLSGALSVLFAVLLVLFPSSGALTVVWLIAAYAIAAGITLVVLGLRLRRQEDYARA